jgi:hypothetical protein
LEEREEVVVAVTFSVITSDVEKVRASDEVPFELRDVR